MQIPTSAVIFDAHIKNNNTKMKKTTATKKATPKKEATKKNAPAKKAAPKKVAAKKTDKTPKVAAKKSAPKKAAKPLTKAGAQKEAKARLNTPKKSPKGQPQMSDETAARVAAAMARENTGEPAATDSAPKKKEKKVAAPRNNPAVTKAKDILMEGRVRALRHQLPDAVYTTFAELDNKNLKAGNKVIFEVGGVKYTYAVTDSTLALIPELFESDQQPDPLAIFKARCIDPHKLAQKCFGYAPGSQHALPAVKPGDLANLTRFVLAAYLFNDGADGVNVKMYNRHWKYIDLESIAPGAPELPLKEADKTA